jgi:hypothetical protein
MPYKDKEVKKAKHKEYSRKHYVNNQEKTKLATKTTKTREKAKWYLYKSTLKCEHCGFNHIAALDFHHEDPATKTESVHRLISNGQYGKAYEELKKCIVLCANCHRIHHHEDRIKKKNPAL